MNLLLAPAVAHVFQALRVSALLNHVVPWWGNSWWPIHTEQETVLRFDDEFGKEGERHRYNERCFAEAQRTRRMVRGERGGFSDRFVPVVLGKEVVATLVTGPFATERPTHAEVVERWRALTGRQAHLRDPEFASYLSITLSTLLLDREQVALFDQLLERLVALLVGAASESEATMEIYRLGQQLEPARSVERAWEMARSMIDERSPRLWRSPNRAYDLERLGLSRVPEQVLAALAIDASPRSDPVEAALRLDAFQRAAVGLALGIGNVIAAPIGTHGVAFLVAATGSVVRRRARLVDIAERLRTVARNRFGLRLHFGAAIGDWSQPLGRTHQSALRSAESALSLGSKSVVEEEGPSPLRSSLRHLREALATTAEHKPGELPARFDRYLEVVSAHCGHRMEPARVHFEVGFERMTDKLLQLGALDAKSLTALSAGLDRALGPAKSVSDLESAYREIVRDLVDAVERPVDARRERGLRGAIDYINEHFTEDLTVKRVAKVAGFNSTYFSTLFKGRERISFGDYVQKLRLTRAQELLRTTDLSVTRVAELSGYRSLPYFCRAFQREVGKTPRAFRAAGTRKASKQRTGRPKAN